MFPKLVETVEDHEPTVRPGEIERVVVREIGCGVEVHEMHDELVLESLDRLRHSGSVQ